jgi:metal-responsive CopG/Arc/MetJ family transcriptional regulator
MSLAKRTYSLPPDIVGRFERLLPRGERSRFLARLIGDWLEEREREALRRESIEGCREMAGIYREIDREWNSASDEVWRDGE